MDESVRAALETARAAGYVSVKESSYRRSQERQRMAEVREASEREHNVSTAAWANKAYDEQRRLADRLTFVYGVARSLGASVDDLAGDVA